MVINEQGVEGMEAIEIHYGLKKGETATHPSAEEENEIDTLKARIRILEGEVNYYQKKSAATPPVSVPEETLTPPLPKNPPPSRRSRKFSKKRTLILANSNPYPEQLRAARQALV